MRVVNAMLLPIPFVLSFSKKRKRKKKRSLRGINMAFSLGELTCVSLHKLKRNPPEKEKKENKKKISSNSLLTK